MQALSHRASLTLVAVFLLPGLLAALAMAQAPKPFPAVNAPATTATQPGPTPPDGGPAWTTVIKPSNTDYTGTTLANDPHLCFTAAQDAIYDMQSWIKYSGDGASPGATAGFKMYLSGPAGTQGAWNVMGETAIDAAGVTTAAAFQRCIIGGPAGLCASGAAFASFHTLGGHTYPLTVNQHYGKIQGPRGAAGGSVCWQFSALTGAGSVARVYAGSVLNYRRTN